MAATSAPLWVPFGEVVVALPAGNVWDAVKMRADLGKSVLDRLGDNVGPVIHDSWGEMLYFLVPPGSSRSWDEPSTWPRGSGTWVPVPGPEATSGPHWLVPPDDSERFTDLDALRSAVRDATREAES